MYAIIENENEKLYHIEECSYPQYWYDLNEQIKDVLHDFSFFVHLLDYSPEENEKIKNQLLKKFEMNGYKPALLDIKLIFLSGKVKDKQRMSNKRR